MGWLVAIFGGVLVVGGFNDLRHGVPTFDMADKFGVVIGAVLIIAALLYESRNR